MDSMKNCDGIVTYSREGMALRAVATGLQNLGASLNHPIRRVVGIETGMSNGGRRYAQARLDCGHSATCWVVGTTYRCAEDGTEFHGEPNHCQGSACPICDGTTFGIVAMPNPWAEDQQLTKVGHVVPCRECDRETRSLALVLAALKSPKFSHLVIRDLTAGKTGAWISFLAYYRDDTSPTLCRLAASCPVTPKTQAAIDATGVPASWGPTRGAIAEARLAGSPTT